MASDDTPDAVLTDPNPADHPMVGPERRCMISGAYGPRVGLIRLVAGPDGMVWPDLPARLPGRGAWIAPDRAMLETAIAKGRMRSALARAFGKDTPLVPADFADRLQAMLERRALDRLGLELRAGHLLFGAEKLREWARAGRLHLLLHAADAADDGIARLEQALRAGGGEMAASVRLPAGRDALSQALGRDNMVHAGVSDGKAAARIRSDLARWIAFLGTNADAPSGRNDEKRGGGHDSARPDGEGRE